MEFVPSDPDPVAAWAGRLIRRADAPVRFVGRMVGGSADDAVTVFGVGEQRRVEVHLSRYDDRHPPTVIGFEPLHPREDSRVGADCAVETVCVVLDVYGDEGFLPDRDHFLVFPDLDEAEEVRLRVLGPGTYRGLDRDAVDDWAAILAERG